MFPVGRVPTSLARKVLQVLKNLMLWTIFDSALIAFEVCRDASQGIEKERMG